MYCLASAIAPPKIINSGFNNCIKMAIPLPKSKPTSDNILMALWSPAIAASTTVEGSRFSSLPSASLARIESLSNNIASLAKRTTAPPEATASKHPLLPQVQLISFASNKGEWLNSPANPE